MKKTFKSVVSVILIVLTICFTSLNAFAYRFEPESYLFPDSTQEGGTSTEPRFGNSLARSTRLYSIFSDIINENKSVIAVPGLVNTAFSDGEQSGNMIPQGICAADNYILITAYDGEHNSVIYVIDKETGVLKSVVEMPDKNHSGGIAFDGTMVWVAKSTSKKVKGIAFSRINDAAIRGGNYVLSDYDAVINVNDAASFITADNGSLWVGTFSEKSNSSVTQYKIDYSLHGVKAEAGVAYTLPAKAQGAAFIENENGKYLAVSSSYGRHFPSMLYVFKIENDSPVMVRAIIAPPMLEEIELSGGYVYSVFESAATKYCMNFFNRCLNPVDVVTVLDADKLTNENAPFFEKISIGFSRLVMRIRGAK